MWKSIKKFFKRIADCTGISWIARKISSGWKWLFGGKKSEARVNNRNTPQQGESPDGKGQQPSADRPASVRRVRFGMDWYTASSLRTFVYCNFAIR